MENLGIALFLPLVVWFGWMSTVLVNEKKERQKLRKQQSNNH
jgi:preprotein translocase subunit YajC